MSSSTGLLEPIEARTVQHSIFRFPRIGKNLPITQLADHEGKKDGNPLKKPDARDDIRTAFRSGPPLCLGRMRPCQRPIDAVERWLLSLPQYCLSRVSRAISRVGWGDGFDRGTLMGVMLLSGIIWGMRVFFLMPLVSFYCLSNLMIEWLIDGLINCLFVWLIYLFDE